MVLANLVMGHVGDELDVAEVGDFVARETGASLKAASAAAVAYIGVLVERGYLAARDGGGEGMSFTVVANADSPAPVDLGEPGMAQASAVDRVKTFRSIWEDD